MTTREAIRLLAGKLTDELAVCTTGYTCRDVQAVLDRPENFYMIGSMGLAASIGLGLALENPKRKVVVFDGDGAALMGLGNLPMVGSLRPANFIHIVFDNEVFASTGNQPTYSSTVPLEALARAAGYPVVCRAESPEDILKGWARILQQAGPVFFLVKCQPDPGKPMERVRLDPPAMTARFMEAVRT